ncbi:hypothetical protein ACNKU7_10340 [Microbulbifer sp. SA54]|uniref:hypothetical protein n=1 Tax=Microbulbifer sp. SA54 TaxID=3401577 RepID=UPI003AB00E9E
MIKLRNISLVVLSSALLAACTSHPLMNVYDRTVPNRYDGQPQTSATVEKAIFTGCLDKGWVCREVTPGHIEASISVRKHRATADINYSEKSYSIAYKDSYLLDYNGRKNTIHRNYNRWINNLEQAISKNLVM